MSCKRTVILFEFFFAITLRAVLHVALRASSDPPRPCRSTQLNMRSLGLRCSRSGRHGRCRSRTVSSPVDFAQGPGAQDRSSTYHNGAIWGAFPSWPWQHKGMVQNVSSLAATYRVSLSFPLHSVYIRRGTLAEQYGI